MTTTTNNESPKTILLLGGYGTTGRFLAPILLQFTSVRLVLAGRDLSKAQAFAGELNQGLKAKDTGGSNVGVSCKGGRERVSAIFADASDLYRLKASLFASKADLVLVLSSTARHAEVVVKAVLEVGTMDYYDIQYSTEKLRQLQTLSKEMKESNHLFITDGGCHPGLPAALVRYTATQFDTLQKAHVGSIFQHNWSLYQDITGQAAKEEFVALFRDVHPQVYCNGEWKDDGSVCMPRFKVMTFPHPFGKQNETPIFLEEMKTLPERIPELQETAFYVGSMNWFVDWFLSPIVAIGLKWFPNKLPDFANMLFWGLCKFSKPPFGTLFKLEAQGRRQQSTEENKDGGTPTLEKGECMLEVTVGHMDGYILTAISVVACLEQWLDGTLKKDKNNEDGYTYQGLAVEPVRFLEDLKRLGADVSLEWKKR